MQWEIKLFVKIKAGIAFQKKTKEKQEIMVYLKYDCIT